MNFDISDAQEMQRFLVGGRYESTLWHVPGDDEEDEPEEFIVTSVLLDSEQSSVVLLHYAKYATFEMGRKMLEEASKRCQRAADRELQEFEDVTRWTRR